MECLKDNLLNTMFAHDHCNFSCLCCWPVMKNCMQCSSFNNDCGCDMLQAFKTCFRMLLTTFFVVYHRVVVGMI